MKKQMKEIIYLVIVIGTLYGIFHIVNIGCPIRYVTGISCAGCGMTRAWVCVFHGQFQQAFCYHPVFWGVPIVCVVILFRDKMPKRCYQSLLVCFTVIFMAVYIIRMLNPEDTVVNIHIQQGLIWRVLQLIQKYNPFL